MACYVQVVKLHEKGSFLGSAPHVFRNFLWYHATSHYVITLILTKSIHFFAHYHDVFCLTDQRKVNHGAPKIERAFSGLLKFPELLDELRGPFHSGLVRCKRLVNNGDLTRMDDLFRKES